MTLYKCIEDVCELTSFLVVPNRIKRGDFVHSSSVHIQPALTGGRKEGSPFKVFIRIDRFGDLPLKEFEQCFVVVPEETLALEDDIEADVVGA